LEKGSEVIVIGVHYVVLILMMWWFLIVEFHCECNEAILSSNVEIASLRSQ